MQHECTMTLALNCYALLFSETALGFVCMVHMKFARIQTKKICTAQHNSWSWEPLFTVTFCKCQLKLQFRARLSPTGRAWAVLSRFQAQIGYFIAVA